MESKDLLSKIEALEKRLHELESQKKSNLSMFGRSYSQIGNSDSDFLIKTKGQVKIQWGTKFIDLIKDGKINVDSNFIFTTKSANRIGVKDGLYVTDDGSVYLKVGNTILNLIGEVGTTYVSFLEEQETTSEQKYTALQNIGFIYKDMNSLSNFSLKNGIIYLESEEKLYIVKDGALTEFTVTFPNPFTEQFIIAKSDNNKGALLIRGSGISNSLAFEKLFIYNEFGNSYVNSDGDLHFRIGQDDKLIISNNGVTFVDPAISSMFQSPGATETSGFKLYFKNNESTLEVDNLIVRNSKDDGLSSQQVYPTYWYAKNNIVKKVEAVTNPDNPGETGYQAELVFENQYQVGDSLYVYVSVEGENSKKQIRLPFTVVSLDTEYGNTIYVQVDQDAIDLEAIASVSTEEVLKSLKGQVTFLIGSEETPETILRRSEKGIDLVESSNFEEEADPKSIRTRIGNLTELSLLETEKDTDIPIEGHGIYSGQAYFDKAGYIKGYNLPEKDDSSKMASTEWVRKLINSIIPKGTIMAYHGDPSTLEGWHICDGQEGTPDLTGKFIKAGTVEEEGGEGEILLKATDIPILDSSATASSNPGALAGQLIPTFTTLEEFVVDEGGSSNYCLYTGKYRGGNGLQALRVDDLSSVLNLSTQVGTEADSQTKVKIEPKYYSLVFIMKIE